jgi:hypothetical protein
MHELKYRLRAFALNASENHTKFCRTEPVQ